MKEGTRGPEPPGAGLMGTNPQGKKTGREQWGLGNYAMAASCCAAWVPDREGQPRWAVTRLFFFAFWLQASGVVMNTVSLSQASRRDARF